VTRLAAAFAAARGRTGLVPFLTVGFPSLVASLELMGRFERAGVRAIELGIPFSDPIADGAEIQRASEWALRQGVGVSETLELARAFRHGGGSTPLIVMTYANPVVRFGAERFAREAAAAGVDGVLISDLPPDESSELWAAMDAAGLDTITLVAPTTSPERLEVILGRCRGFVYVLSRTGVTGRSAGEAGALPERLAILRAHTSLPVAVGFGISSPADARALRGQVDAVVVGAAVMRAIAEDPGSGAVERAESVVRGMIAALE
jgi:tryptophan synthase alpha chain